MNKWRKTSEVILEFKSRTLAAKKGAETLDFQIMDINPQRIIAIEDNFDYPDILNDYKMQYLRQSVQLNGWTNSNPIDFCLLMLPNGDLLVSGAGNHRAVLSKELGLTTVKANVGKVIYV